MIREVSPEQIRLHRQQRRCLHRRRVQGQLQIIEWTVGTTYKSILLLGGNSKLFWPNGESVSKLGACRAYFELSDGVNVREFVLNFGDATGVRLIENGKLKMRLAVVYVGRTQVRREAEEGRTVHPRWPYCRD